MNIKEQTKNMSAEDRANIAKEVINEAACFTPPIEGAPYINVMFCKQSQGWIAFFGYGRHQSNLSIASVMPPMY